MKKIFNYILQSPYSWLSAAGFLFLLSFFFTNRFTHQGTLKQEWKKIQNYISNTENKFEDITHDSALLNKLINHTETRAESSTMAGRLFGFFLYKKNTAENSNMLFWSNQESTPPESLLMEPDNGYYKKLANGYFLCIKKTISRHNKSDSIIAIGLIPVLYDYYVETVYSSNRFAHSEKAGGRIAVTREITRYPVKNSKNEIIFYVEGKAVSKTADINNIVIWLRLVAVIMILLFIHYYAERSVKLHGIMNGAAFLIITLVILRIISYYTSFPFRLHQFELFDPAVYGANPVQKSLGDLLINAILFCWITLFVWNKIKDLKFDWKTKFSQTRIRVFGIIALICIVAITFMIAKIIRSLAADSNISFDVINFFSLTRFTVSGFAALSILAIGYYFLIRILLYLVDVSFFENYFLIYFVIAITGLMYLTIKISHPLLKFYIIVLAWLLFYIRLQRMKNFSINYSRLNIANSLFWIFLFSVSITAIIIIANREKEWEIRKRLADKIDVQSDPYNERQLNISFTYLDDDFLNNNFYRFENKETNRILRDSIMREGGYLNKFDSRLYVFDSDGKALYNDDAESFNTLNTIIYVQAKPTHKANLYFYETSFEKFTFIFKREAKDFSGKIMGSLFIVSNPEQYSSDALYPELFRQRKTNNPEESPVYSFATYKNGILITKPYNEYSFATTLLTEDKPVKQFEKRINNKSDELWYRSANEKVVVIAKKRDTEIETITLFSYVFCAFLILVGLFNILSVILKLSRHPDDLKKLFQWNIRTQVHSTIIFISVVSFIIIGVATISFFIKRYEQNNKEKLNGTMEIMVNEMEKKLDRQKVFDDQLTIYDSVANQDVQNLVNEVAEIHNVDVNVYDTIGNLQVTSQPLIYRVGFLSKKIHPLAYYHLNRLRQVQYVQEEKLASLNYLSIYAPIRDEQGQVYAYLNIPYFLSQQELKQEISYFLVTIINLNAFIFLIAGVIALFITNRVTRSFSIISEKMKEVNLGKTNEEINWKRDDEIGELVTEYNKMVNKLEVSAAALAQSEREGAWREMARQVAHEIKNPLTPMKLSIQFLQKSIDNNTGNVKELTSSVARTLIEQIDHLSKIAFDFSQFANIGNTYPEKFDLKDVLFSLRDLYQMNENVELIIHELPREFFLYSDKTQMNRLFTNLFQNALEASNGKEKCKIEVNATKKDGVVTVSIKDNGEGIPEGMQSQIFAPNFTTKSSGTGLGLAMCKGIVEQAKGKIWFETKRGIGTEFFVELPLGD